MSASVASAHPSPASTSRTIHCTFSSVRSTGTPPVRSVPT